jgi:hypothetical protein
MAIAAAVVVKAARPWLAVALLGFVLALGPTLHVRGHDFLEGGLPYAWLERALPIIGVVGSPARCGWLVGFGLAVAAGGLLSELARSSRRGPILASALAVLAMAESWPFLDLASSYPAPRFLRDLSRDAERWTVLDATGPYRSSWDQVLHGHAQVLGEVVPVPARLEEAVATTPVLRSFLVDGKLPPRDEAVRALQDLRVRFVIVDGRRLSVARALRVPLAYEGDGIAIFEVPARVVLGGPAS